MRYYCQQDIATSQTLRPTRYGYLRDIRACKILAITECLTLVLTYTARYDSLWLTERYGYLRDMRACKILAITECLILVLTYTARYDSLWLPERYGYLRDMATCEIWLPERYACLQDISYNRMPNSSAHLNSAI